ncbi:MAG: hypothetical protein WBW33_07595 [Bryobacteraceae bacterium]
MRNIRLRLSRLALLTLAWCGLGTALWAGEGPYFVTYTHQMEEPGNLEFAVNGITASAGGNPFLAGTSEFEYGVLGWWTTEFYLDGQTTSSQSTLFTGFRWENRIRMLRTEHWINPVLYVEFEDISGADKTLLEVVGHDGKEDLAVPNSVARLELQRELETKLILGSYVKGWTIAENIIIEKNLAHEPWEFGYSVGVSRPLALRALPERCTLCAENWQVGVEAYGGLGTTGQFGFKDTSQYIAPTVQWQLPNGPTLKFSTGFGLTSQSLPVLFRVGVSYEVAQIGNAVKGLFSGNKGGSR